MPWPPCTSPQGGFQQGAGSRACVFVLSCLPTRGVRAGGPGGGRGPSSRGLRAASCRDQEQGLRAPTLSLGAAQGRVGPHCGSMWGGWGGGRSTPGLLAGLAGAGGPPCSQEAWGAGASLPHMPLGQVVGTITGQAQAWLTVRLSPFPTLSLWCDQAWQDCFSPYSAVLCPFRAAALPGGGSLALCPRAAPCAQHPPSSAPSSLPGGPPSFLTSLGTWAKSWRLSASVSLSAGRTRPKPYQPFRR